MAIDDVPPATEIKDEKRLGKETSPLPDTPAVTPSSAVRNRFFLFSNGINLDKNQFFNWHLAACRWIESSRCPANWHADAFTYQVKTFDRWLHQDELIRSMGRIVKERQADLPAEETIVCAHSNGCAVSCGVLREFPEVVIDELHLIAAAESEDMEKNGLAGAMRTGRLRKLYLYCSEDDEALKAAGWTKIYSWMWPSKWGYGSLGRSGPKQDYGPEFGDGMQTIWFPGYKHSTYFSDGVFDRIMSRVINHGIDKTV